MGIFADPPDLSSPMHEEQRSVGSMGNRFLLALASQSHFITDLCVQLGYISVIIYLICRIYNLNIIKSRLCGGKYP